MSLEDLFKDKPEPEKAPELVTKDMIIGDILKAHPHSAEILMACGMGVFAGQPSRHRGFLHCRHRLASEMMRRAMETPPSCLSVDIST